MAAGAAVIRQASAAALIYSTIAQSLVQDAIASPPRRLCCRVRKRTNRSRRRGRGRSSPNSSGPGDDLFYGSGDGGDGGGDAGGGSGGGGSSWDSWWWRDEGWRMAVLSFFHQVACWICLIHCLHFLAKSVARLSRGGNLYGSGEATAAVL